MSPTRKAPMLTPGTYRTRAGSIVTLHGRHGLAWTCDWDWFAEPDACCDCRPVDVDHVEHRLVWQCEHCGGGSAELIKEQAASSPTGAGRVCSSTQIG